MLCIKHMLCRKQGNGCWTELFNFYIRSQKSLWSGNYCYFFRIFLKDFCKAFDTIPFNSCWQHGLWDWVHTQQVCRWQLSGAVDTLEGWDANEKDLDKLKMWAHANLMRYNKAKYKVLHLGQGNHWYKYRSGHNGLRTALRNIWGYWWMESSTEAGNRQLQPRKPFCGLQQKKHRQQAERWFCPCNALSRDSA